MKISYRLAGMDDLDAIARLVERAVSRMERAGIHQWDSMYPAKEDFIHDILKNELRAGVVNDSIAVVYAVNQECDEQYKNGEWQYTGGRFHVIHRLCVSPDFQNRGIARAALTRIEAESASLGMKSIRLDVFSENPYALRLYSSHGYHQVGFANFRKGKFFLMEKLL